MNQKTSKKIFFFMLLLILVFASPLPLARAGTYAEDKKMAEGYAEGLILARRAVSEIMARSGKPITEQDFIKTYGKLYGQIKQLEQKEGYIITFSAIKNRNPRNAATPFEARLISRFKADRSFNKFWTVTMVRDSAYSRFILPVFADKSCLACHGPREKRPAFVNNRYPEDKSFAFKEGEIMGLISVYMPDEKEEK